MAKTATEEMPTTEAAVESAVKDMPKARITVPLPDGSTARYFDEGNYRGVAIQLEHPDESFRPSANVLEPLKEAHEGRKRHQWYKGSQAWVKRNIGDNPIGERLDSEGRFQEMVARRKAEIEGDKDKGPVPF